MDAKEYAKYRIDIERTFANVSQNYRKGGYILMRYDEAFERLTPKQSKTGEILLVRGLPPEFVSLGVDESENEYYEQRDDIVHVTSTLSYCPRRKILEEKVVKIINPAYEWSRKLGAFLHEQIEKMGEQPTLVEEKFVYEVQKDGVKFFVRGKIDMFYEILEITGYEKPITLKNAIVDLKITDADPLRYGVKRQYISQLTHYKFIIEETTKYRVDNIVLRHIKRSKNGEAIAIFTFDEDVAREYDFVTFLEYDKEQVRRVIEENAYEIVRHRLDGTLPEHPRDETECSWCPARVFCEDLRDNNITDVDEAKKFFFEKHLKVYGA